MFNEGEGHAGSVYIKGDLAYLTDIEDGLEIIDVSNLHNPVKLGQFYNNSNVYNVYATSKNAFLCEIGQVEIIDITNKSNPKFQSALNLSGWVNSLTLKEDLAYITTGEEGLVIVNVTEPTNPKVVSKLDYGGEPIGIQIEGNFAYIADYTNGFEVINISDPYNPVEIGQFDDDGAPLYLHVVENYAFVGDQLQGVEIIQIWESEQEKTTTSSEVGFLIMGISPIILLVIIHKRKTYSLN